MTEEDETIASGFGQLYELFRTTAAKATGQTRNAIMPLYGSVSIAFRLAVFDRKNKRKLLEAAAKDPEKRKTIQEDIESFRDTAQYRLAGVSLTQNWARLREATEAEPHQRPIVADLIEKIKETTSGCVQLAFTPSLITKTLYDDQGPGSGKFSF